MSRPTHPSPFSETDRARSGVALAARLRERREEIEEALFTRAISVEDDCTPDPEYQCGFRATVAAAFEHSVAVIESDDPDPPPLPAAMLSQARAAVRNSIGLDVVLRRYVAGSALLDELIFAEVDQSEWQALFRIRSTALERLLVAVTEEYERERERRSQSSQAQTLRRVQQLLCGEPVDKTRINYDFDLEHVALVAKGCDAAASIRNLAKNLEVRLLLVQPDEETAWAWLGGRTAPDKATVDAGIASTLEPDTFLAVGESAFGLGGWRRSHRQAMAALPVALGGPEKVVRYDDVCLLAAALRDDLLVVSLRETYLQPLLAGPGGGEHLLRTLRAYFASGRNGRAAASALGITRQAVASRIRVIEDRLGKPLSARHIHVETALRLMDVTE